MASNLFSAEFNQHIPDFYRIFSLFDQNNDGVLDKNDLKALFAKVKKNPTDDELNNAMQQILSVASSSNDEITFPVYVNWVYRTLKVTRLESHLSSIFEVLDVNNDGHVSADEIIAFVQQFGYKFNKEEVQTLLGSELDYRKFCELLGKSLPVL